MSSPFPGMDPYLEKHWGDVHTSLITYARDKLQDVLPADLRARVEERVVLETGARKRSIFPDVRILESRKKRRVPERATTAVAMAQPVIIDIPDEPQTERFLEIRDAGTGGKLVTVLEVLSPANKKPSDAQDQYLHKQRELLEGGISLVEIDLLRTGQWVLALPNWAATHWPSIYRVGVRRGWEPKLAEYYAISLREKLPTIHVPLRRTDDDVPLDLQALIELCYKNGRYDDIDYAAEPRLALPEAEARWADRLLRQQGRRTARKKKPRR